MAIKYFYNNTSKRAVKQFFTNVYNIDARGTRLRASSASMAAFARSASGIGDDVKSADTSGEHRVQIYCHGPGIFFFIKTVTKKSQILRIWCLLKGVVI